MTSTPARAATDRLDALDALRGFALLGILLAIPIVVTGRPDALAFWGISDAVWPGVVLLALVMTMMYRVTTGEVRRVD